MSINIKKTDSLVNAIEKVSQLCPFNPNQCNDKGKKMDMDSAIAELKSAFKEYADLIEREIIKMVRDYQAEYENMWNNLIENNDNDVFEIQLDSLMKKNRHLEDKLHGFIAKKADTIFEYSRAEWYNLLITKKYSVEKYVDKNISIGIRQMKKYIYNALCSHNESINKSFFKDNRLSDDYITEKFKNKKRLSSKLNYQRRRKKYTLAMNMYSDTLGTIAMNIMENGWNGNNTRIKKRVRRSRKRN